MTDPYVGQLIFFRVYSGVVNSGDTVYNPVKSKKERLGRILQMHANQREEIKEVRAGDIAAAVGLKEATTGDTLCDPDKVITLEKMIFPEPVIHVAVEPKTKADQEKMGIALNRLAQEDPSFRVRTDEESGQTIISGMGELHLEILVDRMKREFGVEANVGAPQVAYREAIRKPVEQSKASSSSSRAAAASTATCGSRWSRTRTARDSSSSTRSRAARSRANSSRRSRRACARRCRTACSRASRSSTSRSRCSTARRTTSTSNENAFKMAASMAFKDGMRKASPVLLEPMMAVEVETPEDFMGNVMGDLSSRRGMIQGMDDLPTGKVIKAEVPLAEMFGYSTTLRSLSQGRATYTMEFKHYTEAPKIVAEAVITKKAALRGQFTWQRANSSGRSRT